MSNDIEKHHGDNLGGVNSFKFAFANSVDTIPPIIDGSIHHAVTLLTSPPSRWFDGYCTEGTMQLKETAKDSEHGEYQEKEFTGIVPKGRPELIDLFNSMADQLFIIDAIDNNGIRRLIGNKEEPLKLKVDFDTKADVPQRNEYRISFKGTGVKKSPQYNL